MKADEIRKLNRELDTESGDHDSFLAVFIEIAAQLAEGNEHLVRIANPPIAFDQPRWVWFRYNDFRYVVDAREVASISVPDPHHCVIIMRNEGGPDPGRFCDGTYAEVCAKLGIPVEGE